jgi:DNA-binding MarR family transcriptional regulator
MIAVTVKAGNKLDPTISAMQARTLTILSAAPEGLSLNAVAEALAATASATSRICARLVRDGLIDRRSGPGNEIRLSLSPYGISALSNLNRARLEQLEPLLDVLPAEHRATVMQGLHQFAAAAERVGGPW